MRFWVFLGPFLNIRFFDSNIHNHYTTYVKGRFSVTQKRPYGAIRSTVGFIVNS